MKTIPPKDATPATGRQYWRSLDQVEGSPEFKQWLEREFPEGASEFNDPVSRRHFVKIMSASFLLAGMGLAGSGCRKPEERILPFGKAAENYVHGQPQYFATAMPTRAGAIPLVVKSHEGRPIKIEGNPLYPDGNGGTDRYAQASILNLYDPDRATRFAKRDSDGKLQSATGEAALGFLGELAAKLQQTSGEGFCFLLEPGTSPSRRRIQDAMRQKFPRARWFSYDPIDHGIHERAATFAFGKFVRPVYRYDEAKVILSLDCDFIGAEEDAHNHIRRFSKGRKIAKPGDSMNRLYAVESLFTLTGVNADHRLRLPASALLQVAAAIASECGVSLSGIAKPSGVQAKWISECAKDLLANRGAALVVAGYGQPMAVHVIAHAINAALGNVGKTVQLLPSVHTQEGSIAELAQALNGGQVDTLVMLGGNPVYNAPADLEWTNTQRKAKTVVRLGNSDQDETAANCDWHFPLAHYLESWGDALTSDGSLVPVQPLVAPLFGGLSELEFLARIAGDAVTKAREIVQETFNSLNKGGEEAWKKFLHDGFLPGSAAQPVSASLNSAAVARAVAEAKPATPSKDNLEVILHRDYSVDDGRHANNGWMQEFPDPITKITWDNAVVVSRTTARELGVENTDVVEVTLNGRTIKGAIWTQPGMADFSLGIALGYGRTKVGRVGHAVGIDAYPLRTTTSGYIATGATLRKTGEKYPISCTQSHWSMEGRAIVREANLDQFKEHPDFAGKMNAPEPVKPDGTHFGPMYPNPLEEATKQAHHQWGMSIDLNSCVGCGTCVIACQSENNIPIVGKDQVQRGREMHWMRIDRYYSADPKKRPDWTDVFSKDEKQQFAEWIDDVQAVNQPMLCQHCEAAPCESVCPVNATVHDHEGLNVMVYNRCVGTRYCSNNCPYKVRRFNYLDYNKRPLSELKGPFYSTPLLHKTDGEWDLARWWKDPNSGMREEDEWDLIRMLKNPDVTVRMRGIMEKCTFCVQRIEGAKISQKVKAGASGDVVVADGTIKTACEQACPADAIVFGNVADPNSRVSQLKKQHRDYSVLDFLATKPRLTYLARVRNPNPAMPDYQAHPFTLQEYSEKMHIEGDPFEVHDAPAAGEHSSEKGAH